VGLTTRTVTVTTTGTAGSATGSAQLGVPPCAVMAVKVDFTSQPGTTDTTITSDSRTILSLSNNNTNALFFPRTPPDDTAGATLSSNPHTPFITTGAPISISVAQGNANASALKVTFVLGA